MRKMVSHVILAVFLFSCVSENKIDFFQKHKIQFNHLQEYIDSKYLNNAFYKDEVRLTFINCRESEKSKFYHQICNDTISSLMEILNISEINVEKDPRCTKKNLNEIYFEVQDIELGTKCYFYYQYCKDTSNYKSQTIEYKYIEGNWLLFVDKN